MLRSALLLMCVLCAGCYASRARTEASDGGVRSDVALPRDASAPDAPLRDAGTDAPLRDVGPVCREGTPSDYTGPGCSDEVRRCLMRCADDECANDCVTAEPACVDCLVGEVVECGVPLAGCQLAWDAFVCCRARRCEGLDLLACLNDPCLAEADALFGCIEIAGDRCAEAQAMCF